MKKIAAGIPALCAVLALMNSGCSHRKNYADIKEFPKDITVSRLQEYEVRHGDLLRVSYSTGGGMEGETHSETLAFDESGSLIFAVQSSPSHSIPVRVRTYAIADADIMTKLRKYIDTYNLSVWEKLPFDDEMIALDAPSTDIALVFDDTAYGGNSYHTCRISFDNVIPEGGWDILNGLVSLLRSCAAGSEMTDTYVLSDGNEVRTGRDISNSDEEIAALITGFWRSEKRITHDAQGIREIEFRDDACYLLDLWGIPEEIDLRAYQMPDDEDCTFSDARIVQEAPGEYDSSWYITASHASETLTLTVAGDTMYIERTSGSGDHTVLVMTRY